MQAGTEASLKGPPGLPPDGGWLQPARLCPGLPGNLTPGGGARAASLGSPPLAAAGGLKIFSTTLAAAGDRHFFFAVGPRPLPSYRVGGLSSQHKNFQPAQTQAQHPPPIWGLGREACDLYSHSLCFSCLVIWFRNIPNFSFFSESLSHGLPVHVLPFPPKNRFRKLTNFWQVSKPGTFLRCRRFHFFVFFTALFFPFSPTAPRFISKLVIFLSFRNTPSPFQFQILLTFSESLSHGVFVFVLLFIFGKNIWEIA